VKIAIKAAAQLKVTWKPVPTLPDLKDIETALRANPSTPRTLIDKGNVEAAIAGARKADAANLHLAVPDARLDRPSCAVADYQEDSNQGLVRDAELRTICAPSWHG